MTDRRPDEPGDLPDWFDAIPKIELHLHLEGAIPSDALWMLLQKYGGDPDVPDAEALQRRFEYSDFPHFLQTWAWKNGYLREYEDFTFIAEEVARDLAAQNIVYAEVFYSPSDFSGHGLGPQRITEAIRRGLDGCPEVTVALVADLVRNNGPDAGARTLSAIAEVRSCGVVGIGIGGAEHDYPPGPFAPVYERARQLGFRTSAHAGEAAGPESIWDAIRKLKVDRIGHGTRSVEDPRLVEHLVREQIPIELCPLSNVRTGVVRSHIDHPVRQLYNAGARICINTDDPKMFGNSLSEEYRLLTVNHGFSVAEVEQLILDTVDMTWLPDDRKTPLRERLRATHL